MDASSPASPIPTAWRRRRSAPCWSCGAASATTAARWHCSAPPAPWCANTAAPFRPTATPCCALPGVGPATAGALLAFAFARPAVFIETNIRRVFLHQYFPAATTVPDAALLPLVARTLDRRQPRRWYYALMDWGAALRQQRAGNPNRRSAHYSRQSPFAGSRRELRGRVLRLLAERRCLTFAELQDRCADDRFAAVVAELAAEQFLTRAGAVVCIAGYTAPPEAHDFTASGALTCR